MSFTDIFLAINPAGQGLVLPVVAGIEQGAEGADGITEGQDLLDLGEGGGVDVGHDEAPAALGRDEAGVGQLLELRTTDLDESAARLRSQVFKEKTWDALNSLKELYHYHFVNAEGPIGEVEENILKELQYQSSLELEQRTHDRIRPLPLAEEISHHARQELVRRLDSYELEHNDLFVRIVDLIRDRFVPIITRHALSGRAHVNTEEEIFKDPLAISMLIDVFSERGFHAVVDKQIREVPERFDLKTGEIYTRTKYVYRIVIFFKPSEIRRGHG